MNNQLIKSEGSVVVTAPDPDAAIIIETYIAAKAAAQVGLLKVVQCGILMLEKRSSLAGTDATFKDWLALNCPDINQRTAYNWMYGAENAVCNALGFSDWDKVNEHWKKHALPAHEVLMLEDEKIDAAITTGNDPEAEAYVLKDFKHRLERLVEENTLSSLQTLGGCAEPKQLKASNEPVKVKAPKAYNPPVRTKEELLKIEEDNATAFIIELGQQIRLVPDKILPLAATRSKRDLVDALVGLKARLVKATPKGKPTNNTNGTNNQKQIKKNTSIKPAMVSKEVQAKAKESARIALAKLDEEEKAEAVKMAAKATPCSKCGKQPKLIQTTGQAKGERPSWRINCSSKSCGIDFVHQDGYAEQCVKWWDVRHSKKS